MSWPLKKPCDKPSFVLGIGLFAHSIAQWHGHFLASPGFRLHFLSLIFSTKAHKQEKHPTCVQAQEKRFMSEGLRLSIVIADLQRTTESSFMFCCMM